MSERLLSGLIGFVKDYYSTDDFIPLHAPVFHGNEKKYVNITIDSTFVSSVGAYVSQFEEHVASFTNSPAAVATVNGTAALHIALLLAGVNKDDLVLTQPLTFIATCNAIRYCQADPVFIDIERTTLGLSPAALQSWLDENAFIDDQGLCRHIETSRKISACVPMHTFGHPVDIENISRICEAWNLCLVEDAAESLGSYYHGRHTGTFGAVSALSFNGNKVITTGGGGMILSDKETAVRAKHLTTTAKLPHPYEYVHDELGFNYRLPNINAALGVAQMEQLSGFLDEKRSLAVQYRDLLANSEVEFVEEPTGCKSNYWLNAVICPDTASRDFFLQYTNDQGVMTRPVWKLMSDLQMFKDCNKGPLHVAEAIAATLVNLPSGVRTASL